MTNDVFQCGVSIPITPLINAFTSSPRAKTSVAIASAIALAIKAYSIAVAPHRLCIKRRMPENEYFKKCTPSPAPPYKKETRPVCEAGFLF